jgi:site-specific recombinase XerD
MGRTTFKKRITSDEKIKTINPNNTKLIAQFLKAKSRTCSEATVKSYKSDLMIFFCWLVDNGNEDYIKVKKRVISDFFTFIQDEL